MKVLKLPEIRGSLLTLLSISGFSLVIVSAFGNQIEWLSPSALFGLYDVVPLTYWLGVGVMVLSLLLGLRNGNTKVFAVQFLLIYVALWNTPALFERYPSVWDSYQHYFSTLNIINTGSSLSEGLGTYAANYPGFFVLTAVYSLLGNAPVLDMLRFYPFVVSTFTFVALYLTVRTYVPVLGFRTAMLLCALGNVWVQYHFSPQSLGLAAALLIFVFLEKGGMRWLLMALAAFTYLAISHPTSMFIVVGALVLREVIVRFRAFRAKEMIGERTWPISIFITVWILWLITGARMYSYSLVNQVSDKLYYIYNAPATVEQAAYLRTAGNIFPISPLVRTSLLGSFFLLFFLATVILFLRRRKRQMRRKTSRTSVFCLVFVSLILAPMDIFFLQGSIYDRALLFFALAAPMLFVPVLIIERKRVFKVILLLAVVMAAACAITSTYQESLYVVSDRSLATTDFLSEVMPAHSTVIGGHYPHPVWRNDAHTPGRVDYYSVFDTPFVNLTRDGAIAMIFDRTTQLWHLQWGTIHLYNKYFDDANDTSKVHNYSRVLDNGAYQMIYGGASRA